jgi:hypothetical protein
MILAPLYEALPDEPHQENTTVYRMGDNNTKREREKSTHVYEDTYLSLLFMRCMDK